LLALVGCDHRRRFARNASVLKYGIENAFKPHVTI
jgi:hypothetical protein